MIDEEQLISSEQDYKDLLLSKKNATDAFNYAFCEKYIAYAYENSISVKSARGVDGVTLQVFEKKKEKEFRFISEKVKNGTYKFSPYLEILKSKGRGKSPRILSTPTIRDKITLFCLKDFLQYLYKDDISKIHPNEHISRLCNTLKKNSSITHYYRCDIKDFYPSISQNKLRSELYTKSNHPPFMKLIDSALKTPTRSIRASGPPQSGVPQGLSISNILADIYLLELDKCLRRPGMFYARFVDDIVIIGTKWPLLESFISLRFRLWRKKLHLNKDKSKWGSLKKGIAYLGYKIKTQESNEGICISVRESSQQKLTDSICSLVTSYKYSKELKHLHRLNRRITGVIWNNKKYGWLFYFVELNDLSILNRFDRIVTQLRQRTGVEDYDFKKFTNSYWRIKKNRWSSYITNFDNYTIDQRKEYLIDAGEKSENLEKLKPEKLTKLFSQEVKKEIDKMEKDVGDLY